MNQQEKNRAVSLAVQESATSGNVERLREHLAPDFKGYFSGNPSDATSGWGWARR
jgi:hypothetical protein